MIRSTSESDKLRKLLGESVRRCDRIIHPPDRQLHRSGFERRAEDNPASLKSDERLLPSEPSLQRACVRATLKHADHPQVIVPQDQKVRDGYHSLSLAQRAVWQPRAQAPKQLGASLIARTPPFPEVSHKTSGFTQPKTTEPITTRFDFGQKHGQLPLQARNRRALQASVHHNEIHQPKRRQ